MPLSADDFSAAARVVLEDVWYTDALPEWYTPEHVYFDQRAAHLYDRASAFLRGNQPPISFHIDVPRVNGGARTWVMPPVNDQIIFHACVDRLAPIIENGFDHRRIYSCNRNTNDDRLAFLEPQLQGFTRFINDTHRRLNQGACVLEIDLLEAFRSTRLKDFIGFLENLSPDTEEVNLIRRYASAWSSAQPGIPFLNESMFYLGNAYLRVTDRIVSRFSQDYFRFADDYRIFTRNSTEAEALYERISAALESVPMRLNPRKVRIVSGSSSEPALPTGATAWARAINEASMFNYVLEPSAATKFTLLTLLKPERYLNEGVGRLLLGTYRRFALDRAIARRDHRVSNLADQFASILLADRQVLPLIGDRLAYFATHPSEEWRTIWIIYLIEQLGQQQRFRAQLQRIENDRRFAQAVRLWCRRALLRKHGEPAHLPDDKIDDLDYVEAGLRCYGQNVCTGDGF